MVIFVSVYIKPDKARSWALEDKEVRNILKSTHHNCSNQILGQGKIIQEDD